MSTTLKSNSASFASSAWPAAMATYVNRVVADGGAVQDMTDLFVITKAFEDLGLTSAQVPYVCGGSLGVKIDGAGHVAKLYDVWDATYDFLPDTAHGNSGNSVIDMSSGHPQLSMPTAASPPGNYANYKSSAARTFASGSIGCIFSGTLTNPNVSSARIMRLQDAGAVQYMSFETTPTGDGKPEWSFWGFRPIQGIKTYMQSIKNFYTARRMYSALISNEGESIWQDGVAIVGNIFTTVQNITHYNGLALTATVGWPLGAPAEMHRFCIWLNGPTTAQVRNLSKALAALG